MGSLRKMDQKLSEKNLSQEEAAYLVKESLTKMCGDCARYAHVALGVGANVNRAPACQP